MMSLLKKFFSGNDAAKRDATKIYRALMEQSRNPSFYGDSRVPDNQTGRLEMLNMHMSPVLEALTHHGEQGQRLSQSLFDVMRDDLDVALREEGYSDSGVKRRIKPMVQRFYAGLKAYREALDNKDHEALRAAIEIDLEGPNHEALDKLAVYMRDFHAGLGERSLGEIASAAFSFPEFK
jgi:cytochrome b pre-mRNA-processing protein 3